MDTFIDIDIELLQLEQQSPPPPSLNDTDKFVSELPQIEETLTLPQITDQLDEAWIEHLLDRAYPDAATVTVIVPIEGKNDTVHSVPGTGCGPGFPNGGCQVYTGTSSDYSFEYEYWYDQIDFLNDYLDDISDPIIPQIDPCMAVPLPNGGIADTSNLNSEHRGVLHDLIAAISSHPNISFTVTPLPNFGTQPFNVSLSDLANILGDVNLVTGVTEDYPNAAGAYDDGTHTLFINGATHGYDEISITIIHEAIHAYLYTANETGVYHRGDFEPWVEAMAQQLYQELIDANGGTVDDGQSCG